MQTTSPTYIHSCYRDGCLQLTEFRRFPFHPTIVYMQHRILKRDGTPHDENWYECKTWMMRHLRECGSDILELIEEQTG